MRTTFGHAGLAVIVAALGSSSLVAQEPVREFCRDVDFPDLCPGEDCPCVDDTLEIVFEGQLDSSIYEYDAFDPDEIIRGRVVLDTVAPDVHAYSFRVEHDAVLVNLLPGSLGLNVDGGPNGADPPTASEAAFHGGFVALRELRLEGIPQGFMAVFVLSFQERVALPVERNRLVNCNYQLERDVGPHGTRLVFTGAGLTVDRSVVPRRVIDGLVRRAGGFVRADASGDARINVVDAVLIGRQAIDRTVGPFDCEDVSDVDDNGRVDVSDVVFLLSYLFRGGAAPAGPFRACGVDETDDGLSCAETNCP